jgi:uncharacterized protein
MFEVQVIPVEGPRGGDERFIVYRPLAKVAFVGNRAMADVALAASGERQGQPPQRDGGASVAFLKRIGFLVPDPPAPRRLSTKFRPTTAVLLMTNQCQLRCTYCYAAAGEAPQQGLDPELGRVVIDHVCRVAVEEGRAGFDVSLHGGGEPTFAWAPLQACVEHARSRELPARITMTSNGVWSRHQRDWIIDNLDAVTLSVDGAPETQDVQRPFFTGRGSSRVVLGSVAELDRRRFPYAIRLTATAPWERLASNVRFLCETTSCPAIHVEPAFSASRGGHTEPTEQDCADFARSFLEAFSIATAAGRRLAFSGAQLAAIAATHCSAPYDALIVTPRGDLVTCYEVTDRAHPMAGLSTIGRVVDGEVVVREDARRRLHALLEERRDRCASCWAHRTCAGDCYVRAMDPDEGGHLSYSNRCLINRSLTRDLLLTLIAAGNGVWRGATGSSPLIPGALPLVEVTR